MAITWSALHTSFGLVPGTPLAYEHIAQAVAEQVAERQDLEWKHSPGPGPGQDKESAKVELAKDIAAMANSGGGLLVYGVQEGPAPDKYPEHNDIPIEGEQVEQRIRSTVSERIRPYIAGVQIDKLPNPDAPTQGVVAVAVPASQGAPHFYEKGADRGCAPRRNGTHIENMPEQDIARAYRDRFHQREAVDTAVEGLSQNGPKALRFDEADLAAWCVMVAKPHASVPPGIPRVDRAQVRGVLEDAIYKEFELLDQMNERFTGTILDTLERHARTGLHRWVLRRAPRTDADDGLTDAAYAELWHDGSVLLAFPVSVRHRDRRAPEGKVRLLVDARWVESVAAAMIALTRTWHEALSLHGYASVRARLATAPTEVRPFTLWGLDTGPFPQECVPSDSRPVHELEPVDVVLDAIPLQNSDRSVAVELAEGVLHQFGYDRIDSLAQPSP